ncbi:hypothetical protein COOONC_07725 [Cooperia oncophora]
MDLDWLNIMVVREPLERFISGFVNKCILDRNRTNPCYNCGDDIACLMRRQYQRLMGDAQTPSLLHTVEDAHFAPQSWHCELRDNVQKYKIVQYNAKNIKGMINELDSQFSKSGVPQDILGDILSQVSKTKWRS